MKEYALYHRRGWKPKRLVVANRDKDAGTVDLADEAGNVIVTSLPLVKEGEESVDASWATLEGVDPVAAATPPTNEEAAAKQLADDEAAKKSADEAAAKKGGKH